MRNKLLTWLWCNTGLFFQEAGNFTRFGVPVYRFLAENQEIINQDFKNTPFGGDQG